ncbi:MAG TPA: glycine betaine/L-proline ABC transporter ATP-binding protein [Alphaproteobacteria bacterium]|nr:glycine betaine/L-proline ABC transporter ATP-binding protein [Alphaproteobacteria bacterium]
MSDSNDKLVVENLFKVFGNAPDEARKLARAGHTKDEIFRKTGSVVAVNDINLSVRQREIFVVMGLSGSGKSTLVRCFNRLFEPTSGRILLDGKDITQANDEELRQIRLRKIAMVFQHFALFPHKTVLENAEYGLKARGVGEGERRQKALEALELVGLGAWADARPDNLSGGMQQRVGLARGLAVDPEVLLMDEPFSALDPLIRREMQEELLQLQKRFNTTIIFITHDLHEALTLGHHIAIMKDGRFVQVGTPEEIVSRPADDYVSAFTRDVDRSRVLSLGTVMQDPVLVDRSDTVDAVRARIAPSGHGAAFVANGSGRPLGVVTRAQLAGRDGGETVERVMLAEFPSLRADQRLYEAFDACGSGLPLAVLDDDGDVVGMVEPLALYRELSTDGSGAEA